MKSIMKVSLSNKNLLEFLFFKELQVTDVISPLCCALDTSSLQALHRLVPPRPPTLPQPKLASPLHQVGKGQAIRDFERCESEDVPCLKVVPMGQLALQDMIRSMGIKKEPGEEDQARETVEDILMKTQQGGGERRRQGRNEAEGL